VQVFPLDAEGANKDNPIPVNDLGDYRHGRAVVYPGKKGILSRVQINILKDCVIYHRHEIPEDSGVYSEDSPKKAAEALFPGFTAKQIGSGAIIIEKQKPRFSVQVLGPYEPEEK